MRKVIVPSIGLALMGALIFTWVSVQHRRVEQRRQDVRAEAEVLREKMHAAYKKRGETVRAWTAGTSLEKEPAFYALLQETNVRPLKTQAEFDHYDWVQEQLNRQIVVLLTDKKSARKKPKDWEEVEGEVATARANYVKRALSANRREHLKERIPVFKPEENLAPDPQGD